MIGLTVSHYRIVEQLGAGGMGIVYRAEDTRLGRSVALKFLPESLGQDCVAVERFEREARAASALNHPHICTIYDIDEVDGRRFIAMELLEGESLRVRVSRQRTPITVMVDLAIELADALEAAHAKGIVHRDIKPENIFITTRGAAKLLDFGIAKLVTEQAASTAAVTVLPVTGPVALGTLAYMSPEQVRGESLDGRTDLFSLGVVLYEVATGTQPFRGATMGGVLGEILTKAPTAPVGLNVDVPADLERVINKLLEKDRELRYQSARDLRVDLERLRRTFATPVASTPATEQASIVVLPFENLSPDPDNAFFADGLTEEIIADLSKVRALRVISRTSAMTFKGTVTMIPEIARALNVRHVLEGSVRRAGNNLRITAQLIDAATDGHIWAEKYTGTLDDVFELQERLSRRIVDALKLSLTPEEDRQLATRPIPDVRAYDAWLKANREARGFTPEGLERAFVLIKQALEIVGENALLNAALGYFLAMSYDVGIAHDEGTLARAERHAALAVTLDPTLGQAHLALGWVLYKQGNSVAAMQLFRRAVDLNCTDALCVLAFCLGAGGCIGEARQVASAGVAADPLNELSGLVRGIVELWDGRFDEASTWFRKYLDTVAPSSPLLLWWEAQALAYMGRNEEAKAAFERVAAADAGLFSDLSALACIAASGDWDNLHRAIAGNIRMQHAARTDEWYPNFIAACLAMVGDHQNAIDWLELAVNWGFSNHRFLGEYSRLIAPLRGNPRFEALLDSAREKERAFQY